MSAEQSAVDELRAAAEEAAMGYGYADIRNRLDAERTAHRATEAKLREALAEVERLKHAQGVLLYARTNERERATAAESALAATKAERDTALFENLLFTKAQKTLADGIDRLNEDLAATKAKLEAAEAVVNAAEHSRPLIHALAEWERSHGSLLAGVLVADVPSLFAAINGVNARGNSFRQLDVAIAALTTKEAPDER